MHVLVSEKGYPHVPLTEINPMRSVHTALKRFMNHVFINDPPPHKPHGVLSVIIKLIGQVTSFNSLKYYFNILMLVEKKKQNKQESKKFT